MNDPVKDQFNRDEESYLHGPPELRLRCHTDGRVALKRSGPWHIVGSLSHPWAEEAEVSGPGWSEWSVKAPPVP